MPVVKPFFIEMRVEDDLGRVVETIDPGVPRPRHVVNVKNISTLPYGVSVSSVLPSGMARLAFLSGIVRTDRWTDQRTAIPPASARELECELELVGFGRAGSAEPIQCDGVQRNLGGNPYVRCAMTPFDIIVIVA